MTPAPGKYTEIESNLLGAAALGEVLDAKGGSLPASFIADLCAGRLSEPVHPHGVRIKDANIEGVLDLEGAAVVTPLYLTRTRIPDGLRLRDATMRTLYVDTSIVGPVDSSRADITGLLAFIDCRLHSVTLHDAKIQGTLVAEKSRIRSRQRDGFGFAADRIAISGSLLLRNGFRCYGGITIIDCRIGGSMDFSASILRSPDKMAIKSMRADVGGSVFFNGARVRGAVQLLTAVIGGVVEFTDNARLKNPGATALYLDGARIGGAVLFRNGFISWGELRLSFANVGATVEFDRASMKHDPGTTQTWCVTAQGLVTASHFQFTSVKSVGPVTLARAKIGGDVNIKTSELKLPNGVSSATHSNEVLIATGVSIGGEVRFTNTAAFGAIKFGQSSIRLSLGFEGGSIEVQGRGNASFYADDATFGGAVYFSNKFASDGEITLNRARVNGRTGLAGCNIRRLKIAGAKIHGGFYLADRVRLPGGLSLAGSEISGPAILNDAVTGDLSFAGARFRAGLNLMEKLNCLGEVTLTTARIEGTLKVERANICSSDVAFRADGIHVDGNVIFSKASIAGRVRFRNADIRGDLDFGGTRIAVTDARAMRLTGSSIKGSLFLRYGFMINGGIRLSRAKIAGNLDFEGGSICSPDPNVLAIEAHGLEVQGLMTFRNLRRPFSGTISFNNARVGRLQDEIGSWEAFDYRINGFEFRAYDGMRRLLNRGWRANGAGRSSSGSLMTLRDRIGWLENQKEWSVQPYEHTARIFRDTGFEDNAQAVLIAKYRHLREKGSLARPEAIRNWLFEKSLGYGYRTWPALLLMTLMLTIGSFVFQRAETDHVLVASKDNEHADFNRYTYSIDAFVPLINLKQRDAFMYVRPLKTNQASVTGFEVYFWFHTAVGWIVSTLVAAGLTGLVRKE